MPIHLKLLLACLFWGATPIIGRVLAEFEAPFVVVCGRFAVATVLLLWFTLAAHQFVRVPRRSWWRFLLIGVTGILLHNGLLYKGLEYTSATTASVILALIAVQVVAIDVVCYRRVPDLPALAGVALSFIGTAWVMTGGDLRQLFSIGIGPGEVLVFLSALSWAIYSVVGRDLLEEYSALVVTTYATVIGLVFLIPFLFMQPAATVAVYSDPRAVALIVFLGLLGSAVGFLWYYQAVVRLGAVATSVYINVIPIFSILMAAVFLGEEVGTAVLIGGALVFAGLSLLNRPKIPWRRMLRRNQLDRLES